jgi:hypothetical protein
VKFSITTPCSPLNSYEFREKSKQGRAYSRA